MTIVPPLKRHTNFKDDVLRLVSGTSLAQLIGVLAAPILTRLYAPEAFGVAAFFVSVTGIFSVLSCMRYELSIVLPENDREAANLLAISASFSVISAGVTFLLIWFFGPNVLKWAKMPELAPYLWLVPIMVLISGIFLSLNYWNTRTKHFTRLSIARVTNAFTNTSGNLVAGFAGHATGGAMIAAYIGGQFVATAALGGQILRDNGRFIFSSISRREMWEGLCRYRKFPIYGSWAGLLNTISWQLPVLILGGFFSSATAGFYALGFRILQMPMSLIGGAISQVFHQRAAEAISTETLAPLVEVVFSRLFIVALFPMLMLTIVGRDLYIVVFGEHWAEAGVYTQILAPWALVWFVSSPMSNLFGVLGRQEQGLKVQVLIFFSRLVALSIGVFLNSAIFAIALFSASGAVVYGYLIVLILRYASVQIKPVLCCVWDAFLKTVPYLSGALICMLSLENSIYIVIVATVLSALYFWTNRAVFLTLIHRGEI